ncbi:MAG TPA: fumarylacetoacetate hydrolase family protein [Acidimicrobiales bacterium]|nr:fumarylacetoacetate hydrolase family protein [Acidimicrobiales bacterium]
MRLVRFETPAGVQVGRIESDDTVVPIAGTVLDNARRATREPGWVAPATGDPLSLAQLTLEAPVERPGSLRDFYAFERHVATARAGRGLEMDPGWYERPVFYFSNPGALLGPGADVATHPRTQRLDFELELAWVVGWDVAGADEDAAAQAIVGYTVMNDWSARDVQREEMALNLGPAKGKDFATSLGPVLVTADEFDPRHGAMRAWVNGRLYSEADLGECYWSIPAMTAYAAEATVVREGDVCGTGTCGTGCILELSLTHGEEQYPWLQPGDVVELEIEGIGRLANRVVATSSPPWRSGG